MPRASTQPAREEKIKSRPADTDTLAEIVRADERLKKEFAQITLPVSMTGFPEAMDRMKTFAKERAVALPANTSPLPPAPPAVAPAPAKK